MRRNAHTPAKLLVVVMISTALTVAALPRLSFAAVARIKAAAVAYKSVAEICQTRAMARCDPASNVVGFRP